MKTTRNQADSVQGHLSDGTKPEQEQRMVIETRIQAAPTTEPNDDDNLLIDGRQLAEWLGLSPRTLEIWRWRGGGPAYVKIGKAVRYRKGTVRQWMASREYENTSQY